MNFFFIFNVDDSLVQSWKLCRKLKLKHTISLAWYVKAFFIFDLLKGELYDLHFFWSCEGYFQVVSLFFLSVLTKFVQLSYRFLADSHNLVVDVLPSGYVFYFENRVVGLLEFWMELNFDDSLLMGRDWDFFIFGDEEGAFWCFIGDQTNIECVRMFRYIDKGEGLNDFLVDGNLHLHFIP